MAKKLFELLAVEQQLKNQAQVTRKELQNTFDKKRHLFEEKRKTFTPLAEGAAPVVEEQSDIQSTIPQELQWIAGIWTKQLDVSYQVAEGNTQARADIVLDNGTVLLANVPATALLELEKRSAEIQELIKTIPTLDPAKGFKPDTERGANIYKARDVMKSRTHKVTKPITLAAATPEHPAQVQLVPSDEVIGKITEQEWSSLITPARKAELISKAEELQRACKAALHRANSVELPTALPTCGKAIFDFVFKE